MITSYSNFPSELWIPISKYLTTADFTALLQTCKDVHAAFVDNEAVYKMFALRKYPIHTLIVTEYYENSYKTLLQNDNAENGIYVLNNLRRDNISQWNHNDSNWGMFYVNAIPTIVWDRREKTIQVVVEGYGENDLRPASQTTIFRDRDRLRPIERPQNDQTYTSRSYNICLISYSEESFLPNCTYRYTYNGSYDLSGTDYPCIIFLEIFESLKGLFNTEKPNCQFLPRPFVVKPSDITTWPFELPNTVLNFYNSNQWGTWEGKEAINQERNSAVVTPRQRMFTFF